MRRAARPARLRTAPLRPAAGRLRGADEDVRGRCVDEHSDPGRARRRATLLVLAPRGSLRRSRHHRLLVRRSSLARTSLAARLERVALGRLRGGADRSSLRLARPRLLPEPRRTTRKESRQARARAQAPTPRAPHPLRARRRRALPRNLTPFRAQLPSLS